MEITKNREKLLPIINPLKREELKKVEKIEFDLSVNKLLSKTKKDPYDIRLEKLAPIKEKRPVKKQFGNLKEEQHYRLNRKIKLKDNEKIANYLSQKTSDNKPKILKNENDLIEDAGKQLKEVNMILNTVESKCTKKLNNPKLNFNELNCKTSKNNIPTDTHVKHICTKGMRSRINNYNTLIEKFEKQLKHQEKSTKNMKYLNSSNSDIIKYDRKNNVDNYRKTETNVLQKFGKNFRNELIQPKRTHIKYKSLKDLKIDEEKLRQFEKEVCERCNITEDLKEMRVLYENSNIKKYDSDIQSLEETKEEAYGFNDFLRKHQINRIKPVVIKPKPQELFKIETEVKNIMKSANTSPRKVSDMTENIKKEAVVKFSDVLQKLSDTETKTEMKKPILTKKLRVSDNPTKSIGLDPALTEAASELHKSILKSDFLTKEFHLNTRQGTYPMPDLDNSTKSPNFVNWADKFKVIPPKKWSKEFDFIVT